MTDDRDICERLEDPNYDGALYLRREAAKGITALRYRVALLEGELASEQYQHAKTKVMLEKAQEYSSKQALDIVTLGQEVGRLREALAWYGEQARLARLIHSEGDPGRHALSNDGGARARAALAEQENCT